MKVGGSYAVRLILGDSNYCQIKTRCLTGSQGNLYLRKQHLAGYQAAIYQSNKAGGEFTDGSAMRVCRELFKKGRWQITTGGMTLDLY